MYSIFQSSSSSTPERRVQIQKNHLWTRLLLLLVVSKFSPVEANHRHFCFNAQARLENDAAVPDSIGMESVFDPANSTLTNCPYVENSHHKYVLKVHPVKYKDDYLFGWFHLRVVGQDPGYRMRWTLMQAQTTGNEVVPGEFLRAFDMDSSRSCQTTFVDSINPPVPISKANYVPCYFVADPNPTVSYGFGYPALKDSGKGGTALQVNYRLTFPICGFYSERSVGLYFRTYIICTVTNCVFNAYPKQGDVFFKDYVGGAHDPPPPKKADLDCSKTLLELQKNNARDLPRWISRTEEPRPVPAARFNDEKSRCRDAALRTQNETGKVRWFGRCQYYNSSTPINSTKWGLGFEREHYCETLPNNLYYANLSSQSEVIPKWDDEEYNACVKSCRNFTGKIKETGMPLTSDIGKRVYSYRQGHALFMIFVSVFFTPISHFVAHFYKETYFNYRIVTFHVWYSIHVSAAIMTFLAIVAAQVAGVSANLFFGYSRSKTAQAHVVLGWMNIVLYVVVFLFHDYRYRGPRGRIVSVFLHYLAGSIFSLLNTLLMILSCYIPGSPSARYNPHEGVQEFEGFMVPVMLWTVFDLAITIFMNFGIETSDRHMKFKRKRNWAYVPFFGVPIPMLRPYSHTDLDGDKLRKIFLFIYVGLSTLVTLILVSLVMTNPLEGRNFGKMFESELDDIK